MITPQEEKPELARALGIKSVFLKREDLHPYGSHKGRSIPVMIDIHIAQDIKHFAISSSGNSALAAAFHIKKINEKIKNKIILEILLGKNIKKEKFKKIEGLVDENILISTYDRPLQALFIKTKDENIKSLRQSTDDTALIGYHSLAEELLEIPDLKAVFIGTSSGTTAQALSEYFIKKKRKIEIHIVQTSLCHPIADAFVNYDGGDITSIADAIVDERATRKDILVPLIINMNGNGWIALNEQIISAQDMVRKYANVSISTNSALSVAGLMEASYTGKTWDGAVVCMICGE